MDDQGCPRCKTTKYRNPSLKLLVNVCGHSLCESCVDLLFIKGSGNCPECGTSLRRTNYRLQLFEDAHVEKEVDIRKKILKDYNKKERDFDSLREYNDYLENLEVIIFNLTNNIDVEQTKKMVDQYKKENKDTIQKNRSKLSKDEEYLEMLLAEEQQDTNLRRKTELQEEEKEKIKRKKKKEALIDELMFSEESASKILADHQFTTEKEQTAPKPGATTFSSGATWGFFKTDSVPVPSTAVGEAYMHTPIELEILGPPVPDEEDVINRGYLQNIRGASDPDKAGGYDSKLACHRALLEAMCGLFLDPRENPT